MTDRRPTARLAGALLALVLVAAACGDDSGGDANAEPSQPDSTTTTAVAGNSPEGAQGAGSALRADLTSLLQEHVYLAGLTVEQLLDDGGVRDAIGTQKAIDALDASSVDLSNVIGSAYGVGPGEQFLELWRTHIDSLVDYTIAVVRGDDVTSAALRADLTEYREDLGAFLESVNDQTTAEGAADDFEPHVDTLLSAIDSAAAADPAAWTRLRLAAQVMPGIALTIAEDIAEQQGVEGAVDSPGAELRADLTNLLQEHVYLTGAAIGQTVEDAGDVTAPTAAATFRAIDQNSDDLADTIGGLYGRVAGNEFLEIWNSHVDFFIDYALAVAAGDAVGVEEALENLDGFREDLGAFLESANDLVVQEAMAAELEPHVDSLLTAIDAIVGDDAERFALLRDAAQVMPITALTLATTLQIDA